MAPKKRPASSTTVKAPPKKNTKKAEDGLDGEDHINKMKEMILFLNSGFEPEKELAIEEVTTKEEEKERDEDYLRVLELYLEKTDKDQFPNGATKIQDEIDRMKKHLEPKDTEAFETEEEEPKKKKTPKAAATPAAKNKVTKPKSKPKAKTVAKNRSNKEKENQEKEQNNEEEEGKKKKKTKGKTALLEETAGWAGELEAGGSEENNEEKDETGEEVRDRQKAQKLKKLEKAGQLPEMVKDALENAEKSASPRLAKTQLINRLFKKEGGQFIMVPSDPAFVRIQKSLDTKFGKEENTSNWAWNRVGWALSKNTLKSLRALWEVALSRKHWNTYPKHTLWENVCQNN